MDQIHKPKKYKERVYSNIKNRRPIYQYSIDNQLLNTFDSLASASIKLKIKRTTIQLNAEKNINLPLNQSKICNKYKGGKYKFKYADK